ncbi:MAG: cytochrome c maturation protein CcmE [Actinomycetota bacterium]|nr:cytochrome c maturation protein CcmE [Actinomycetota bacterium]
MPDPGDGSEEVPLGPAIDLTPSPARPERVRRRPAAVVVVVLLVAAVVAVLLRTLGDASLFFYEVSEAVDRRTELADARFRVVGTPQPGLVELDVDGEPSVVFTLCAGDVLADVAHVGDPAELFQPGVPVVLQGAWVAGLVPGLAVMESPADDGWYLRTDHMVVKHDNDYRAEGAELAPCGAGTVGE